MATYKLAFDKSEEWVEASSDVRVRFLPSNQRILQINSIFTGFSVCVFVHSELPDLIRVLQGFVEKEKIDVPV